MRDYVVGTREVPHSHCDGFVIFSIGSHERGLYVPYEKLAEIGNAYDVTRADVDQYRAHVHD